jgi:hypothetical protein
MSPKRIQLSRKKGWRKPEGTIIVARPSTHGNFYKVTRNKVAVDINGLHGWAPRGPEILVARVDPKGHRPVESGSAFAGFTTELEATRFAVDLFRRSLLATWAEPDGNIYREFYLRDLVGHDLACWCPLTLPDGDPYPCHAAVLLTYANDPTWLATREEAA